MTANVVNPSVAASLYAKTSSAAQGKGVGADDGISFSDFLKQKVSDSIDTIRSGEKASAAAVTGQADLTEVVQAVTSAELTLQTVVAVRDRLISAYQEIMRMPI